MRCITALHQEQSSPSSHLGPIHGFSFSIIRLNSLLFTIILIIFPIVFDYFRGLHPNFQELADAKCRPMRRAMTDKCPGAPAKVQDEHASSLYEAKPTYLAEQILFYTLFLVLYQMDQVE